MCPLWYHSTAVYPLGKTLVVADTLSQAAISTNQTVEASEDLEAEITAQVNNGN